MASPRAGLVLAVVLGVAAGGCVIIYRQVEVEPVEVDRPVTVTTPLRAHLTDGSLVLFPSGAAIDRIAITGRGERWPLTREPPPVRVESVPLDSVIGVEAIQEGVDPVPTALLTTLGTAVGVAGTVALLKAIFGSCPTIYYEEDGEFVLVAEVFSNSFAPLLEARDVHRLAARPSADGRLRLEVRNEALETHYIDQLELLEVRHGSDEAAFPDERSRPLVLSGLRPPARAVDRAGRDLLPVLTGDAVFETDPARLAAADADDPGDHIDLAVPVRAGADSVALLLRVRNSLLTTVLMYDVMLGASGARALEWVGRDLQEIGPALELGQWAARRLGMRVSVLDGGEYRHVVRIPDTGPIGWKDLAVTVPTTGSDPLHVRLDFVADAWRIDRIAVTEAYRRPPNVHVIPAAEARDAGGEPAREVLARIRDADGRYLETTPGQRFTVSFDVGAEPDAGGRSLLLAAQGYYSEWIRPDWIRDAERTTAFEPSDEALHQALDRWRLVREPFEAQFFGSRVPVRAEEP